MSDLKKSKSSDYGDAGDLDTLLSDLDEADQKADHEIQILETKRQEIKQLEEKLSSVSERLSEFEGEAKAAAEADVIEKIEQKADEAEQCEANLQEIAQQMQEKQSEVNEQMKKREEAFSEIEAAEQECDVRLDEAKDAIKSETQILENASAKIDQILGKVDNTLSSEQSEKKNRFLDMAQNCVELAAKSVNQSLQNLQRLSEPSNLNKGVAATITFAGLVTGFITENVPKVTEVGTKILIASSPSLGYDLSKISKDGKEKMLGSNADDIEMIAGIREEEDKNRKKAIGEGKLG